MTSGPINENKLLEVEMVRDHLHNTACSVLFVNIVT